MDFGRLQMGMPDCTHDDLRRTKVDDVRAVERKQAALFAYCISYAVLNRPIAYAMDEDGDYDCVLWHKIDGKSRYTPVQLKEIAPAHLNLRGSIEEGLAKLKNHYRSSSTIVAFHVDRSGHFDYYSIKKPETSFAEIWFYASLTADQPLWGLYGDLLHEPQGYEIPWPMPQ